MRLLQFTDLHLRDDPSAVVRNRQPQRCFEQVLYHAQQRHWPPDAVLLTGDLAHDEYQATYSRLSGMARQWRVPVLALSGNHDDGPALRAAFTGIAPSGPNVLDIDGWRIIGLDSQAPGSVHGELDDEQWRVLEQAAITAEGRYLLVALHHPPVELGSAWMDRIGLHEAAELRQWLGHLGVRVCLFGHAHQAWSSEEHGVRYLGTPSTGRQFLPGSDTFAESDDPPAYRWLELADDGSVSTGVEWVEAALDVAGE